MSIISQIRVPVLVMASALGLSVMAGCPGAGQVNYPPIAGDTISNSVNNPPVPRVLDAALEYVVLRYPPNSSGPLDPQPPVPFAVNLPALMNEENVRSIISNTSPFARALTEQTQNLPIYHVARVNVRGGTAYVDILRPVSTLPDKPVNPLYQGVRVELRGLSTAWRVNHIQLYPVGTPDVPRLNLVSETWDAPVPQSAGTRGE